MLVSFSGRLGLSSSVELSDERVSKVGLTKDCDHKFCDLFAVGGVHGQVGRRHLLRRGAGLSHLGGRHAVGLKELRRKAALATAGRIKL